MLRVTVPLDPPYDVVVGRGAVAELAIARPVDRQARRGRDPTGHPARRRGFLAGLDVEIYEIGDGEEHKSLATIETLTRGFARQGLTRHDVVSASAAASSPTWPGSPPPPGTAARRWSTSPPRCSA